MITKPAVISGIYSITNPKGQIYIGRSKDIQRRWGTHKKGNDYAILKLYESFQEYGVENHSFKIVEVCSGDDLVEKEAYYQNLYKTFTYGLNSKPQSKKSA